MSDLEFYDDIIQHCRMRRTGMASRMSLPMDSTSMAVLKREYDRMGDWLFKAKELKEQLKHELQEEEQ